MQGEEEYEEDVQAIVPLRLPDGSNCSYKIVAGKKSNQKQVEFYQIVKVLAAEDDSSDKGIKKWAKGLVKVSS